MILMQMDDTQLVTREYLNRYFNDLDYLKFLSKRPRNAQCVKDSYNFRQNVLRKQVLIKRAISRVKKNNYKQILTMRYIYGFKWSKIIETLFKNEQDFELQKDYKYRDKAFRWHRQAINALRKINQEENTAIQTLKKIKKLYKSYTGKNKNEKEFITEILTLIGI